MVCVHTHPGIPQPSHNPHRGVGRWIFLVPNKGQWADIGQVYLACFICELGRIVIFDKNPVYVLISRFFQSPVWVGGEDQAIFGFPFQLVWPKLSRHVSGVLGNAKCFKRCFADNTASSASESYKRKRSERLVHHDYTIVFVNDVYTFHGGPLTVPLRLLHSFIRKLNVFSCEFAISTVPHQSRLEFESNVRWIGVTNTLNRTRRLPFPGVSCADMHQGRHDGFFCCAFGATDHVAGVKYLNISVQTKV